RTILAAGLDVFVGEPRINPALLDVDNLTLFPHVGSASQHTRNAMGQLVVDNLAAFAAGKPPNTPGAATRVKGGGPRSPSRADGRFSRAPLRSRPVGRPHRSPARRGDPQHHRHGPVLRDAGL